MKNISINKKFNKNKSYLKKKKYNNSRKKKQKKYTRKIIKKKNKQYGGVEYGEIPSREPPPAEAQSKLKHAAEKVIKLEKFIKLDEDGLKKDKWSNLKNIHKYYKELLDDHKSNLKEKIQAKLDLRKKLLQDFFHNVFELDAYIVGRAVSFLHSFGHINCFEQKKSEDDEEFQSYTFKEFTAKKGIEEVALMSTAGSGYKVSSDIDFDFQILPKKLVNMPVANRITHIENALDFVKRVKSNYNKNIAFAKCFDTNFYFSMYFWHPFDSNLLQLKYYAQAIYYKIFLRYMILPENIFKKDSELSEEEKITKAEENERNIKNKQFEGDDIFANDEYKKQIIKFYKNGETDFNPGNSGDPGDPKNEYNLYESYCNEFISYLTDLKSMSKENDNTDLTKTVCRMLLLQPESYVFPYTTASVSLNLPEIDNFSKQQGGAPSSEAAPPSEAAPSEGAPPSSQKLPLEAALSVQEQSKIKSAIKKVVNTNRLRAKESYKSKFSDKHQNFLININNIDKILIVEYLTIFENLSDLIFNLKGKYLLRAILNIVYTLYFINLNKEIKLDITSFNFIVNYLKNIKSGSLDEYINPIVIDYIYECISMCTLESCSLSQLENIDQVKDIKYDENKKMDYIRQVNDILRPPAEVARAEVAPPAPATEVAPAPVEVASAEATEVAPAKVASAEAAELASAADQDSSSYKINKVDEIKLRTKACNLHSKILEKLIELDKNNENNLNTTLVKIQQQLKEKLYPETPTEEKKK